MSEPHKIEKLFEKIFVFWGESMFYPLEVSFFGDYICFGNRKEKVGSFGLSLLKNYNHNQLERNLDEWNLKLISGSKAPKEA